VKFQVWEWTFTYNLILTYLLVTIKPIFLPTGVREREKYKIISILKPFYSALYWRR
jgi:hypothetical protein